MKGKKGKCGGHSSMQFVLFVLFGSCSTDLQFSINLIIIIRQNTTALHAFWEPRVDNNYETLVTLFCFSFCSHYFYSLSIFSSLRKFKIFKGSGFAVSCIIFLSTFSLEKNSLPPFKIFCEGSNLSFSC